MQALHTQVIEPQKQLTDRIKAWLLSISTSMTRLGTDADTGQIQRVSDQLVRSRLFTELAAAMKDMLC